MCIKDCRKCFLQTVTAYLCTTYIKANETQTSCELSQFCKREWTFISLILSWFWRKVVVINVFPKVSNAYPVKIKKIWTSLVTPQWPSFSGLGFWGPRGLYPPSHKSLTSFQINDVKFLGKWIIIVSIVIYLRYVPIQHDLWLPLLPKICIKYRKHGSSSFSHTFNCLCL